MTQPNDTTAAQITPAVATSDAPQREKLLEVRNLKKHFPIRKGFFNKEVGAVRALDGVNLDVYAGETLGLVGE